MTEPRASDNREPSPSGGEPVDAEAIDEKIVELGEKIKAAPAKAEPERPPQHHPRKHPENFDMGAVAHMIQSTIAGSEKYGRVNLFRLLRERGVLREGGELHNTPRYDPYIKDGLFTTNYVTRVQNGITRYNRVTFVTPNGLAFVADLVEQQIAEDDAADQSQQPAKAEEQSTEQSAPPQALHADMKAEQAY